MSAPGIGVMIGMIGGNGETVAAHEASVGKIIQRIHISDDDRLTLEFADGTGLEAFDNGQSCCESRYMRTDDEFGPYIGATFLSMELREAPDEPDEWGEHEVQFLLVNTSAGTITIANHNEHNGYYGGFWVVLRTTTSPKEPA